MRAEILKQNIILFCSVMALIFAFLSFKRAKNIFSKYKKNVLSFP